MTKEDVHNLNLILKCLKEINNGEVGDIADHTKLDITLIQEHLLPILLNRKCVKIIKKVTQTGMWDYSITAIGKEYLDNEKFKKEFQQEQRMEHEFKLLKWRIKTYWVHWVITIIAFGLAVYSTFCK